MLSVTRLRLLPPTLLSQLLPSLLWHQQCFGISSALTSAVLWHQQ